jgi:Glycoside hydrolase family 5 C-terminal domain
MSVSSTGPSKDDTPTEIFLPDYHFPEGDIDVTVSGGKWSVTADDSELGCGIQRLKWWHGEGNAEIKVKGVTRGGVRDMAADEGYVECASENAGKCIVM